AIALAEFQKLVEFFLRRVGVDVEGEPDLREADRRILGDAERATKVEIAFGRDRAGAQWNVDRGRDRLQRDAGARYERLQQHVAGAQFEARAAGGGMQAGDRKRAAGLDLAGDIGVVERALGLERDESCVRLALVALLDRRLQRAQSSGIHGFLLAVIAREGGQSSILWRRSSPLLQ